MFSDEASFDLNISDIKLRFYRKKNERFEPEKILEKPNRVMGQ